MSSTGGEQVSWNMNGGNAPNTASGQTAGQQAAQDSAEKKSAGDFLSNLPSWAKYVGIGIVAIVVLMKTVFKPKKGRR